jgi:hypothetical protein
MQGLVYQSIDWLNAGFLFGNAESWNLTGAAMAGVFQYDWWKVVMTQVKHIHCYNQMVVYEKGNTYAPLRMQTVGTSIPYGDSGTHEPVDWNPIIKRVQTSTKSQWKW